MYGIPNMKLDKHLVERRIKLLEEAGVTFELNSEIGHKISSETLLKQFDAIALCTGSTVPRDLTIPGRELQGIHFAKDYLHSVTKSFLDSSLQDKKAVSAKGKDVIVIGGGDTGTDCVATAIRQGCRSVKQIEIMPCLPIPVLQITPGRKCLVFSKLITGRKKPSSCTTRIRATTVS